MKPPEPTREDIADAIQAAQGYDDRDGIYWDDKRGVKYLGEFKTKDLLKKTNDDYSGWLDLEPGDEPLYRSVEWTRRMRQMAESNKIPPVILVDIPKYGIIVGDGRGRINYANATGAKLHAYLIHMKGFR